MERRELTQKELEDLERIKAAKTPEEFMEAMRASTPLPPEERALFNKYGDPIDEYGLMEPLENPESSSTEQATKSPPST